MSQLLPTCLTAGMTYTFTVDLAHTNVYDSSEPNGCYSSLAIYGGNTAGATTDTLWLSGMFTHTNWTQYTITVTPAGNWCYLTFAPYFITPCGSTGFDFINVMIDNFSCIAPSVLTASASGQDATCANPCNGAAFAAASGGTPPYSFNWQPGNISNDSIFNLCAGTYTVTITDSLGQTSVDSVTITAPAALGVSVTLADVTCFGDSNGSAQLIVSGGLPSYTYNWQPIGDTTSTITGLIAGTYTCSITDSLGCSISQIVTITEPAAVDTSVTVVNETLTSGAVGATYQWLDCSNGMAPIAGEINQSFTAVSNGTYAVAVTVNNCSDTSSCYTILSTGIAANTANSNVSIYPNPNSGTFFVEWSGTEGEVVVMIKDVLGKVVYVSNTRGTKEEINLQGASGVYFISLQTSEGEISNVKFIVQ